MISVGLGSASAVDDVSFVLGNLHDVSAIPGTMDDVTRWLTEDEQRAWRGLLQMTARLDVRLNRSLQDECGLSLADYEVLVALSESTSGRLRVFEVADAVHWEQSRLSHHLARMSRRGLVERQECPSDRRGAYLVLTEAGRAAIDKAAPAHVDSVRSLVFDALDPADVEVLAQVTSTVLERLTSTDGSPRQAPSPSGGTPPPPRGGHR